MCHPTSLAPHHHLHEERQRAMLPADDVPDRNNTQFRATPRFIGRFRIAVGDS